jgi:hypothetical protein
VALWIVLHELFVLYSVDFIGFGFGFGFASVLLLLLVSV